jgi:hypothetical protein
LPCFVCRYGHELTAPICNLPGPEPDDTVSGIERTGENGLHIQRAVGASAINRVPDVFSPTLRDLSSYSLVSIWVLSRRKLDARASRSEHGRRASALRRTADTRTRDLHGVA